MFNNSYMSQYFLYILAFAVVMLAQSRVQAAYHKYKRIPNEHGLTGEAVARRILDMNNLQSIRVEVAKGGMLSDHYDPVHHVVRLSPDIFYNASIASISVAAQLGWVVLVLGLFLFASTPVILYAGIAMICIILLFQIVTLPVEFNASSRAVKQLAMYGMISEQERYDVKGMLRAAAFTYVAAVLSTLAQILRILLMVLGRRDDD